MCTYRTPLFALITIWFVGLLNVSPSLAQSPVSPAAAAQDLNAANSAVADQTGIKTYITQPVDKAAYILGQGDRLSIVVFGAEDVPDRPVDLGADGDIMAPIVGRVNAGGLSVRDLESLLTQKYRRFFKDPEVTVTVVEYRSQPVTIVGSVNTPGVIQLRRPTRLMEVISQAGGLRPDAGDRVLISRKPITGNSSDHTDQQNFATEEIDLRKIIEGQDSSLNILVRSNDLITVPKAKMVYVVGDIGKPGGYVLDGHSRSISVLQAIALAGGVNRTAAKSQTRILQAGENTAHRTETVIDLKKILANKAPDVELHADDILFVPNSAAKTASLRAMEAAVNIGTGIAIWK